MEEKYLSSEEGAKDKSTQYAYLDLLATTLTEHEKNLDKLLGRLEKISENLSEIDRMTQSKKPPKMEKTKNREDVAETLIYMKLKISRPSEELKMILDSLKE